MTIISNDAFVRLLQSQYDLKIDGIAGAFTLAAVGLKVPGSVPIDSDTFVRLYQRKHALKDDGWAGRETLALLDSLQPRTQWQRPTRMVCRAIFLVDAVQIESGDRPFVQAETSRMSGLYQFIRSSWIGEGGAWGTNAKGRPV